jgi:hypothetical protein
LAAESGKRRPWWAVALMGGFGAVLGVLFGFGLIGNSARGEIRETHATIGLPAAVQEAVTAEQVRSLSAKIDQLQTQLGENIRQVGELNGRLNRLEGRLERK